MNAKNQVISRRSLMQKTAGLSGSAAIAAALGINFAGAPGAAAQDSTPTEGQPGGTITVAFPQGTSYAHFAHMLTEAGSENVYSRAFVQGKLLSRNYEQTEYLPDLAESWEYSEDNLQLTFHLREGLTWHDGEPFDSSDVDFTFHVYGVPGLGSYNMGAAFNGLIAGNEEWIDGTADRISGVSTPDEHTVVFDLLGSFSDDVLLAAINSVCMAPEHILNEYLDRSRATDLVQSRWATTADHVGIGPFRVIEYVPDQHVIYEPFENYYAGKPLLDRLIFRSFSDFQTNVAALETQEVDIARIGSADLERISNLDYIEIHTPVAWTASGSVFNTRQEYLNKAVRQGLVHAIDRQAIIDALFGGVAELVHSPISVPEFGDSPELVKYDYDPEKAKALLEEGGWDSNRKLRWAVTELPSTESTQSYFAAINGYWEAVGVQTEFQVVGSETAQMGPPDFNFDLYQSSYTVGSPQEVANMYDPRDATYVSAGYDAPGYTDLWDKALLRLSPEETQETIWALQEIIAEECLGLMIARGTDLWGVNTRTHNVRPKHANRQRLFNWHSETFWVDQ